jgi:hypothetical protein
MTRRIRVEHRAIAVPPIIRLKGKWLVAAGFTPGTHVQVTITGPGQMTITQSVTQAEQDARLSAALRRAA